MKRLILKYLIIIVIIVLSLATYLSTIGIETNKFNNQISTLIKNINKDLDIELKQIKLVLDPFNFKILVKTLGSKLKIKENKIDIQNIETTISINSFIKKKFSLTNLEISTNSIEIENLISFLRKINDSTQLYIFEKIVKKGYLISNINLEFDEDGKIKDNYIIKGFIKDGRLSILKKYELDNIECLFNITNNNYQIQKTNLLFNKTPFFSEKITIKKIKEEFSIEGSFENDAISLNRDELNNFFISSKKKFEIDNLNFFSKNNFKFKLSKKLKITNLKLSSKVQINDLNIKNGLILEDFFPNIKKIINIRDQSIDINYENDKLQIDGFGKIFIQDKEDNIEYLVTKKDNQYNFNVSLILKENPFKIKLLGYQKNKNIDSTININGIFIPKKKIFINLVSLVENDNKISLEKLNLGNELRITDLEKINLNYIDESQKKNNLKLEKKDNRYYLSGEQFNADYLLNDLINDDSKNNLRFINKDLNLDINLKKVRFDSDYTVKNLLGYLNFRNNKILNANVEGFFNKNEKLQLTINSKENNKVTTLFLDKAEPLVKRYNFIKGFKNGSLDFYSSSNIAKSTSTLKIYDFNLKELPILTKILTLASLQGIADILSGDGITFNEFEMKFSSDKNGITIDEIYAIGPAISILMDGYYIKDKLISLRGTLVTAKTINNFFGSIPVLGKILVGKKTGEGVFGVSFKIKGNPKNPKTSVNPIKTLTPRFITRTLEKIKKN